jgi:uncharacterized membrane protein YhaH (DUF805 family)
MGLGYTLFAFSGRINRAKWWLSVLAIVIIYLAVLAISRAVPSPEANTILVIVYWGVSMWISLAAGAKRLHDLNRTGAWLVLFVGAPFVLIGILIAYAGVAAGTAIMAGQTPSEADLLRIGGIAAILGLIWLVIAVWGLIWFGCLRGTVGPNQYGQDPLEDRL